MTQRPPNLQCEPCRRARKLENVCVQCNRLCCKHRCGNKLSKTRPAATGATCSVCMFKNQEKR